MLFSWIQSHTVGSSLSCQCWPQKDSRWHCFWRIIPQSQILDGNYYQANLLCKWKPFLRFYALVEVTNSSPEGGNMELIRAFPRPQSWHLSINLYNYAYCTEKNIDDGMCVWMKRWHVQLVLQTGQSWLFWAEAYPNRRGQLSLAVPCCSDSISCNTRTAARARVAIFRCHTSTKRPRT